MPYTKPKHLCKTKGCRRPRSLKDPLCGRCRYKVKLQRNPLMIAYHNLKSHAKARGKVFELTFEQFREFCIATDYIAGKGRHSQGYHVDRIDETKGYTIDNIQVLTNADNVRKYLRYSYNAQNKPDNFTVITDHYTGAIDAVQDNCCPGNWFNENPF